MLIAAMDGGGRVEASGAVRGKPYHCPLCEDAVHLKAGRIVTPHFAHRPEAACAGAREGAAHLTAKQLFYEEFRRRGLRAELEYPIHGLPGDRRADVAVWSPAGRMCVLELQDSPISLDEIEARSATYARQMIAQAWIPFEILAGLMDPSSQVDPAYISCERFSAAPFFRWIHGLHGPAETYVWDPLIRAMWLIELSPCWLLNGDYPRRSRRWRNLAAVGPFNLTELKITTRFRRASAAPPHRWPAARLVQFRFADGLARVLAERSHTSAG
jgi:hypothetical protein